MRSRAATCGSSGPAATTGLWDELTNLTFGSFDLLKILSSYPGPQIQPRQPLELSRAGQRAVLRQGDRPQPAALRAVARCARSQTARPTRSRTPRNIPAWRSARAARTSRPAPITATRPGSSACGCSPIPISTRPRRRRWDAERFYNDPDYYLSKELVRPYRVGMSCGFCHVGPNPEKPPANPEAPQVGESELDRRRAVFLGRPHLCLERRSSRPSSSSSCTRRGPARSTPRWCRATTSTIRAR